MSIPQRFDAAGTNINAVVQDFEASLANTVESNLKLIDELPPIRTLSMEDIKGHLRKLLEADLRKDLVFEKSVEIGRYANDIWTFVNSYYAEIFSYHNDLKEEIDSRLFDVCRMFFGSDLPLSFLTSIENSLLIQKDYLDIYDRKMRSERLGLLTSRNNRRKFERMCDAHNRWITPFCERLDRVESTLVKLAWYVDFANSNTTQDIFKVKVLKSSCLDMKELAGLISHLQKEVEEVETLIEPMMEFHPFVSYEGKNGARAIRRLMELLNAPEG